MRTPGGQVSRSRVAQRQLHLFEPAARRRVQSLRNLGLTEQVAEAIALHPLMAHPLGVLQLLGAFNRRQWLAVLMLGKAIPPQSAPTSQLSTYSDYAVRIDTGRRVASRVEADTDDEEALEPGVLGRHSEPTSDYRLGDRCTLFQRTIEEFLREGMTASVAATAAREAVREECGADAWRLLEGLLKGHAVPAHAARLTVLKRALDVVYSALAPGQSDIGMSAREIWLRSRRHPLASEFGPFARSGIHSAPQGQQ